MLERKKLKNVKTWKLGNIEKLSETIRKRSSSVNVKQCNFLNNDCAFCVIFSTLHYPSILNNVANYAKYH